MVHGRIGVAQWDVADDAERDKRNVEDVARLGNGSRFHVDGLCLGKFPDNLAHLFLGVCHPVARDRQSLMKLQLMGGE